MEEQKENAGEAQQEKTTQKEFTLPSSGKKVVVYQGKGKDARLALRDADGDADAYLGFLMARLTFIDGKQAIPEELDELDLKDYGALQTEFAALNF